MGRRGQGARGQGQKQSHLEISFVKECILRTKHDCWFRSMYFGRSAHHMGSTCHKSSGSYIHGNVEFSSYIWLLFHVLPRSACTLFCTLLHESACKLNSIVGRCCGSFTNNAFLLACYPSQQHCWQTVRASSVVTLQRDNGTLGSFSNRTPTSLILSHTTYTCAFKPGCLMVITGSTPQTVSYETKKTEK